jgi:hypothetical protein
MQFKKQEHKMFNTNMKTHLYYANICKHEHEKNMTKSCLRLMLNRLKEMKVPTSIYTSLGT